MQDTDVVGQRIRQRRAELGLTQEDLAARMQVRGHSSMYYSRVAEIEVGKRYVRPAELIGFSRVLRIPITWLLGVADYEH